MKTTLLTNLLIAFAIGLCALCTFQWLRETESRRKEQRLQDSIFQLRSVVQDNTNRISRLDLHVAELTDDNARQKSSLKSNDLHIISLRRETNSLGISNETLGRQLEAYIDAFKQTTNRLAEAYDSIRKQNDAIKGVLAQRDDYVAKLNAAISNNNSVVSNYNALVDRLKLTEELLAAARTNKKAN